MSTLTKEEELRYNRQIMLRQFDFDGQEALKKANVLIIGLGGLGCSAAQYLAASGVGHLTLVDDDKVELSNLHRQILHHDSKIGMLKVHSAAMALKTLNPFVSIEAQEQRLDDVDLLSCIKQHHIVLDCTDNLKTRNQLNALCAKTKTPLVSGAAIRLEGQISVFTYEKNAPCYACFSALFTEQHLSCVESGVLSPIVGIIGTMQALEAIKLIVGLTTKEKTKVQFFDALTSQWQGFLLPKNPDCPICSH